MSKFLGKNFDINNKTGRMLYNKYAKHLPIFDFHCHLNPKEIAEDKPYENLTQIWLYGDHYKWRAMRSFGIEEEYITGDKSDYQKFYKFASMMPYLIGNPIYLWTHLELKKYFNIKTPLCEKNAKSIWDKCNKIILQKQLSPKKFIELSNTFYIATTDDPTDDLKYHSGISINDNSKFIVAPTFRPDKVLKIENNDFIEYVSKYGKNLSYKAFMENVEEKLRYFTTKFCKITDHSLEKVFFQETNENEVSSIFDKAIKGESLTIVDINKYKTWTLLKLAKLYSTYNLTMQLHIGALRNNNSKMFNKLGADSGFDSIDDSEIATNLSKLLNELDKNDSLPKTILYVLNPKDNEVIGTMCGNFQNSTAKGKIQFGSGWWFNDQKDGITRQLTALSQLGLLSTFVGMVTDSRSFTSYIRHDLFRRVLCNYIGELVENGEYPNDKKFLKEIVVNICYKNAEKYFLYS